MKRLILIGGPMGVGKTAVGRALRNQIPNSVFLDGDWCWDANPFGHGGDQGHGAGEHPVPAGTVPPVLRL